jgi:hypothetical protein
MVLAGRHGGTFKTQHRRRGRRGRFELASSNLSNAAFLSAAHRFRSRKPVRHCGFDTRLTRNPLRCQWMTLYIPQKLWRRVTPAEGLRILYPVENIFLAAAPDYCRVCAAYR